MTEREARAAIVAYAALVWQRGLAFGASGNLSARLGDGTLVVTPTGSSLRALAEHELVRTKPSGEPLDPDQRATSELPLHLAAYRVRPDVRCVIHTHPTSCIAWSNCGCLFPLATVGATESLGPIGYTRFEKPGTKALADACAEVFARGIDTVVMERHGLTSVAADFETAFARSDLAEQTARIELEAALLRAAAKAAPMSQPPPLPHDELRAAAPHDDARATVDALHAELATPQPDRGAIEEHVERLRGWPALVAPVEAWYLDPRTQSFIAELGATGLLARRRDSAARRRPRLAA